ncbi:hypothetical protein [Brevibacillus sp. SIMBA_040]|uniref:hypothetical protein n=1 Tax=unclassified Brevibacillus TaxID=2684853 RepID=UPI00397DF27F
MKTIEKAKKIAVLLEEIDRRKQVLSAMVQEQRIHVHYGNSNYWIKDESVIELTIEAYKEVLDQKILELEHLVNGDLYEMRATMERLTGHMQ